MKKIVALALTVVMVLGLLAGCEKPMDAKTLTQKMDEAMKTVTAMSGKMGLELDMTMSMTGMTLDMGMDMEMDMKYNMDLSAGYMDLKFAVEAMGQNEEMGMEAYITSEGDNLVSYVYDSASDMWMKTAQDTTELKAMQEQMTGVALTFSEIPAESMTLAKEQETVNGKSCYVLTVNMDGTYFQNAMGTIMDTMTEEMDEMDETAAEMLESMDWTALSVKAVYHVDAATFQIVQMTGEVLGMGDMLNNLIGTVMGEMMMGEDAAEMEFSIDIPTCAFSMTEMAYNDIEIPAVPQEAIDNAVDADSIVEDPEIDDPGYEDTLTNPAQADGSFLLSYEDCSASVMVPEGYIVYMSEADMLVAMTVDMMQSISYVVVAEATAEDMKAEYESMVEMYKEQDFYLSHGDLESVNGFTVKTLISNDGTSEVYAWKEIPGGVVMVTGSSFEGDPVLDDALNGVVTGE